MAVKMRVEGIPFALLFISSKKKGIEKGITDGALQGGNLLRDEVKASIRGERPEPRSVDTGAFRDSVNIATTPKRDVVVFSDVEHAKFLEFGTTRIPARRHFQNSADRKKTDITKKIESSIRTNII